MRKFIVSVYIVLIVPALVYAGFSFGLMQAAKKTVDKVDEKVAKKIAASGSLYPNNHAPMLLWTGETNYISAGLNISTGTSAMTCSYRVKYRDTDNDAPKAGSPTVHIKKGGSEILGSPFVMNYVSGGYTTGAMYNYSRTLSTGTDYTYYFEAQDSSGAVAASWNAPTATIDAPDILPGWTFGGTGWDDGYSVQQTSDDGYIIVGDKYSSVSGGSDVWLIKTSSNGAESWEKIFPAGSGGLNVGFSVQQTLDSGYIITGYTDPSGLGDTALWLIKTNSSGTKSWDKTFGGASVPQDGGKSVQQTSDSGYIIVGSSCGASSSSCKVWLAKTDSSGNKVWDKTFGGSNYRAGASVQETSDGGYIIVGSSSSGSNSDAWLIKTDSSGNMVWDKVFGGSGSGKGYAVQQTSDGGYILTGLTWSLGSSNSDAWLLKTDSSGNKLWDKAFGGSSAEYGRSVQQTSDSGYIVVGMTTSFGAGSRDVWLFKTDSNGTKLWDQTFGGSNQDDGYSVQQTSDGGYIVVGQTFSCGAGNSDVWMIKTDSSGNAP